MEGMDGGGGDDVLYGENGKDDVSGWGGEDVLYGGDGSDNLDGHDGRQRDKLYCGEGRDYYSADKLDQVDSSCEVKQPPSNL
jgi:Ca2+-binding RTX toxin-like protein